MERPGHPTVAAAPKVTAAEQTALWAELAASDGRRRELLKRALLERYLFVAKAAAKRIFRRLPASAGFDQDELVNDGVFGLSRAIERFDPSRGVRFETFAQRYAVGAILDAIRKFNGVRHRRRYGALHQQVSLDSTIDTATGDNRPTTVAELLSDAKADYGTREVDAWDAIENLMGFLSRRSRLMVKMRMDQLTIKDIGLALGVSESRVSQLLASAIEQLRHKLAPAWA